MGGDHLPCPTSEEDELSLLGDDFLNYPYQDSSFYRGDSRNGDDDDDDDSISDSYEFVDKKFDEVGCVISSNSVEIDGNLRRRKTAYNEIMRNYDELWVRKQNLYQAKSKILSYKPGSWISNPGGKKLNSYIVPKTTTLLLIGPKGSGKSSLVNRISRVFEDDMFASERAQVTYNPSTGEGTYFLQEYMIPRGSTSFCLFDTRSLSENFADNDELLQRWMTKGVRHGELVIRDSDPPSLKMSLKCKAQQSGTPSSVIRKVNFVIYVVNGFQVLKAMNSDKTEDKLYMDMVIKTFSFPYLSFKDDKPVVVVTHGDLLSLGDRTRVRLYLGEKLGIPPAKQIFDIPDNSDPTSEVMMVDMIRYSLEHADKNIAWKESTDWVDRSTSFVDGVKDKVSGPSILVLIFTAILLGIACIIMPINQVPKVKNSSVASVIEWPSNESRFSYNPQEPLMTFESNSESNSAVNHSQKIDGFQNAKPEAKPTPTVHQESVLVVTSEPTVTIETLTSESEQTSPFESAVITSEPILSSKPGAIVSEPTFPSKSAARTLEPTLTPETTLPSISAVSTPEPALPSESVADYHHKRRESRSSSAKRRHPKLAVKWHKIRHLWLDE